mgnify:CR=1 FL=1
MRLRSPYRSPYRSHYRSPYKNISHLRRSPFRRSTFRRSTYGGADAAGAAGTAAAALNDYDESVDDDILLTEINEYLENLKCPITKTLQVNPVIIESGHSFDRKVIENWFKRKKTCPITNDEVNITLILPNYNLQSSIERFVDKYADKEGDAWGDIRELCRIYKEARSEERAAVRERERSAVRERVREDRVVAVSAINEATEAAAESAFREIGEIEEREREIGEIEELEREIAEIEEREREMTEADAHTRQGRTIEELTEFITANGPHGCEERVLRYLQTIGDSSYAGAMGYLYRLYH